MQPIPVPAALFWLAIGLRVVLPPILFLTLHPFWATVLTEVICDLLISPHHHMQFFTYPYEYRQISKYLYDKPLDFWGQLWALYPILFHFSPHYNVFGSWKGLLLALFAFRVVGYIVFMITRRIKTFIVFPNLFFSAYVLITGVAYFNIRDGPKWIYGLLPLAILITIFKEIGIHGSTDSTRLEETNMDRERQKVLRILACIRKKWASFGDNFRSMIGRVGRGDHHG